MGVRECMSCVLVCMYVYVYEYVCAFVYEPACVYLCVRVRLYMCVRMCVCPCVYPCMHTSAHALPHIYIHVFLPGLQIVDGDIEVLFSGCQSEGQGQTFESSGNRMSVYFMSDESTEKAGFVANYEGI